MWMIVSAWQLKPGGLFISLSFVFLKLSQRSKSLYESKSFPQITLFWQMYEIKQKSRSLTGQCDKTATNKQTGNSSWLLLLHWRFMVVWRLKQPWLWMGFYLIWGEGVWRKESICILQPHSETERTGTSGKVQIKFRTQSENKCTPLKLSITPTLVMVITVYHSVGLAVKSSEKQAGSISAVNCDTFLKHF